MTSSYDYFDHDADMGIIGKGITLEEAFEGAAAAMFATMSEDRTHGDHHVQIIFTEHDLELALVTYLNSLLAGARNNGLNLNRFALTKTGDTWTGDAWGHPWSDKSERGTEVKGATLTMLTVSKNSDGWEARCVIDV